MITPLVRSHPRSLTLKYPSRHGSYDFATHQSAGRGSKVQEARILTRHVSSQATSVRRRAVIKGFWSRCDKHCTDPRSL